MAWPGTGGGCLCAQWELEKAAGPGLHIAQIPGWGGWRKSTDSGCWLWIPGWDELGKEGVGCRGGGRELPCFQTSVL